MKKLLTKYDIIIIKVLLIIAAVLFSASCLLAGNNTELKSSNKGLHAIYITCDKVHYKLYKIVELRGSNNVIRLESKPGYTFKIIKIGDVNKRNEEVVKISKKK